MASSPEKSVPAVVNSSTQLAPERAIGSADTPTVPGYEVLGELGRGGMGAVYMARQVGLNRLAALKMVLGSAPADSREIIRFLAEAEVVASVRHPHVVGVYEYGEYAGRPFLALEYCPGGSLSERLRKSERYTTPAAAELVRKLAAGVGAAHALGIVHRDLKPGNVLFDAAGEPKVTDFGLAKRTTGADLTDTKAVMGTPAYMSPEQARGDSKFVGPQADVWALGVILYECLSGRRPFAADDSWAVLQKVMTEEPAGLRVLDRAVPRDLDLICRKCLAKDPRDRYPTAAELAADLGRFLDREPVTARPPGAAERVYKWARKRPWVAGLAAALVVALVGGATVAGVLAVQYREAAARAAAMARDARDAATLAEERERAAEAARVEAAAEAARANQVSDFMTEMFQASDPLDIFGKELIPPSWEQQQRLTARDFLDKTAAKFESGPPLPPLVRARLLATIGNCYTNLGLFAKAEPLLREALALRRQHLPPDHPDVAHAEFDMGRLELDTGRFDEAEARFLWALEARRAAGAPPGELAVITFQAAQAGTMIGKASAEALFREVLALREQEVGPNHRETITARIGLVTFLIDQGRVGEIPAHVAEIRAALENQPDGQHKRVAGAVISFQEGMLIAFSASQMPNETLRRIVMNQSVAKFRAAVAVASRELPPNHIYALLFKWILARALDRQGETEEAVRVYAESLAGARVTIGLAHPRAVWFIGEYALFLAQTGRPDEGRSLLDEAAEANQRQFGEGNLWRVNLLALRGRFEAEYGTPAAVAQTVREITACVRAGTFARTRHTVMFLHELYDVFPWAAHPAEWHNLTAVIAPLVAEMFPPGSAGHYLCRFHLQRGRVLAAQGQPAAAADALKEAEAAVAAGPLPSAALRDQLQKLRDEVSATAPR